MTEQQENQDDKRILERMPYLSELMRCIADVNQAIRQGESGKQEAENLLSDLPLPWYEEISGAIGKEKLALNKYISEQKPLLAPGIASEKGKHDIRTRIHQANQNYARAVKREIINLLYKKDLLLLTKKKVEQSGMSLYALGESENE